MVLQTENFRTKEIEKQTTYTLKRLESPLYNKSLHTPALTSMTSFVGFTKLGRFVSERELFF